MSAIAASLSQRRQRPNARDLLDMGVKGRAYRIAAGAATIYRNQE
jgi:hypothetical protein